MQALALGRVGVVGGTGRTGRRVVGRLRKAGYFVRVLARRESEILSPDVHITLGDALDLDTLECFSAGLDAVICTLGPDEGSPPDLCSRATALLVQATRKNGVSRLIVQIGPLRGNERLGAFDRFLTDLKGLPHEVADRRKQERIVRASNLDWTLIRPPRLSRDIERGDVEVTAAALELFNHLSRSEVAEAMMQAVAGAWSRQSIALVHRHGRHPALALGAARD